MKQLTAAVTGKARALGGDLVGVAPVARFRNAPRRMSPRGLLPGAKTVLVIGIHHPDATIELGGEPTPHDTGVYSTQLIMNARLDEISFLLARFLEDRGFAALPIAASNIWRYHPYKDLAVDFAPDLAHRYAAVAAGLGEIGWSGLLLTREFGPRQRVVSVVTEANLAPTPMYAGPPLCDKCLACVNTCPTDAFRKEVSGINEVTIGRRTFRFPETNKWRCAWAENFSLNLALPLPEKINEAVILEQAEKHGLFRGEEGCCLKFCMVPGKRYADPAYCRAPRRKKTAAATAAQAWRRVTEICRENGLDICAISRAADIEKGGQVHPRLHLPDAATVITLGLRAAPGSENQAEVAATTRRALEHAAFAVTHYLDRAGFAAVMRTKIPDSLAARQAGVYEADTFFATVLTSAGLKPAVMREKPSAGQKETVSAAGLKAFARAAGADLAGVFNAERFAGFQAAFTAAVKLPAARQAVVDRGAGYGHAVPEIVSEPLALKAPGDHLAGAQAVLVLGRHYPHSVLDTAKTTPAETIGPYVFAQSTVMVLLRDLALKVVRHLNARGWRATFTSDLTGLASQQMLRSRGLQVDNSANLFPAVLAGLALPGLNGCPLSAEYGPRQRFIAVVTDCPLENDPLGTRPHPCDTCDKPCLAACPTGALGETGTPLRFGEKTFAWPAIDQFSCDWAKRYGLSGEEGPRYCGLDTDRPLPREKNVALVAAEIGRARWGAQKRHANVCEECLRVCPAGSAARAGRVFKEGK